MFFREFVLTPPHAKLGLRSFPFEGGAEPEWLKTHPNVYPYQSLRVLNPLRSVPKAKANQETHDTPTHWLIARKACADDIQRKGCPSPTARGLSSNVPSQIHAFGTFSMTFETCEYRGFDSHSPRIFWNKSSTLSARYTRPFFTSSSASSKPLLCFLRALRAMETPSMELRIFLKLGKMELFSTRIVISIILLRGF